MKIDQSSDDILRRDRRKQLLSLMLLRCRAYRKIRNLVRKASILAFCVVSLAVVGSSQAQPSVGSWDTQSDTWVGVDGLGRPIPTVSTVGTTRANKTVGIFYFLTFDQNDGVIYDNSKTLAAYPEAI